MQRFSQHFISTAFFITCVTAAFYSEAAEQKSGSSMQLPSWVESIGQPTETQVSEAAPEEAIVPVVQPLVRSKSSPGTNRKSTETAPETVTKPTNTTQSKPTLSERAARLFDPEVLKTAWNDLLPSPSEAKKSPRPEKIDQNNKDSSLGPETSVLKKGDSADEPTWQRPLAAARSLLQTPQNVNETSAIETTGNSANKSKTSASTPDEPTPTAPLNAPIAEAPDETPTLAIDPASFRGAYPGKTTRADIDSEWGPGQTIPRDDGTECFFWKIEPFERVAVTFRDGIVTAIQIKLAKPVPSSELAKQLEIADLRTVAILDDDGSAIGQVFPERGVMFSLETGTTSATAVLLESLDADSFVLRAEGEMKSSAAFAVADLEYAIDIDPTHLRAHRLLLALMCDEGRWKTALQLAEKAEELGPGDAWTGLKRAEVLLRLDRPEDAQIAIDELIERPNVSSLLASQAGRLRGRIELDKATLDYEQTVDLFTEAIRKATPLAASRSENVRSVARQVLLDAHLGTAQAIAQGTWQQKNRVIPKWISRANNIVEKIDTKDPGRDRLELDLT
ncbi:MAG: tetratricopeptide repeat protein, partial [Pirellulales bacterium]|nr:tetratricopeptide repeat protein [Pirellulales bacterium]